MSTLVMNIWMLLDDNLIHNPNINLSTGAPGLQGYPGEVHIFASLTVASNILLKYILSIYKKGIFQVNLVNQVFQEVQENQVLVILIYLIIYQNCVFWIFVLGESTHVTQKSKRHFNGILLCYWSKSFGGCIVCSSVLS